jgi:hypothetical protein
MRKIPIEKLLEDESAYSMKEMGFALSNPCTLISGLYGKDREPWQPQMRPNISEGLLRPDLETLFL